MGSAFLRAEAPLCGASATGHEVHDDGDDREEQKQMNEQARALEHNETAEPHHNQNDCQNKKHRINLLSCYEDSH
jgi:hypothetical protein